ncbi:hypothetical protein [Brachybacterium sp. UMB0905]|uniref:hypothetical protein n=1 Tax=Brachybacterium sp. UMB0905 TaxID=2069310 RepID=UPI0013042256|nr:hypothetical protein [Brachybacterium sp. UMB0905]
MVAENGEKKQNCRGHSARSYATSAGEASNEAQHGQDRDDDYLSHDESPLYAMNA